MSRAPTTAPLRNAGFADRVLPFVERGWLNLQHAFLVDRLAPVFNERDVERMLWFALTLEAHDRGHSALHLHEARKIIAQTSRAADRDSAELPLDEPVWPSIDPAHLRASGFLHGDLPPIALGGSEQGPALQAQRMSQEEMWIAQALRALTGPHPSGLPIVPFDEAKAKALFDGDERHPALPALRAMKDHRFALITGGPGTGKTFTLVRVLAHLIAGWPRGGRPLIRLAAPTGKAAVRMEEAIAEAAKPNKGLPVDDATRGRLGLLRATTLHRLLGLHPSRTKPRHGPEAPLEADIVVVDEASMMDLPLTRKLLRALKPTARLVLVGDRDQLPSVDVGSFLGDLVKWAEAPGPDRTPAMVRLTEIRRTDIAELKDVLLAIQDNAGQDPDRERATTLLVGAPERSSAPDAPLARLAPAQTNGLLSEQELTALLHDWLREGGYIAQIAGLVQHRSSLPPDEGIRALFKAFDAMRLLAVHRRGPAGVSGLRRRVTQLLRKPLTEAWERRTASSTRPRPYPTQLGHWLGEPILITRNSPDVNLYNGDIGLVLPGGGGTLIAAFPGYGETASQFRRIPLARLPEHESAVVMTVHKSQGSQFGHAVVVLSPEPSPIQTRELIYTGLSRAKNKMTWVGTEDRLREGLKATVIRGSLLLERLRGEGEQPVTAEVQPAGGVQEPADAGEVCDPGGGQESRSVDEQRAVNEERGVEEPENEVAGEPVASVDDATRPAEQDLAELPPTIEAFLWEHLPPDGTVISTRELRKRAAEDQDYDTDTLGQALAQACETGMVVHEGRSYRLAAVAPVSENSALARVTAVIQAATEPQSRAELIQSAGIDEGDWARIREALVRQPAIVRFGKKRGTRYISRKVYEGMLAEIRERLRAETGAQPQERRVLAVFEGKVGEVLGA